MKKYKRFTRPVKQQYMSTTIVMDGFNIRMKFKQDNTEVALCKYEYGERNAGGQRLHT